MREREKLIDIHSEKGDFNIDFTDSIIRGFDGLFGIRAPVLIDWLW